MRLDKLKKQAELVLTSSNQSDYDKMKQEVEKAKSDYFDKTVTKKGSKADLSRFTSDDIKEIAKRILEEDYRNEYNAVQDKLDDVKDKSKEKLANGKASYLNNKLAIESGQEEKRVNSNERAFKNDMARSSIAEQTLGEIEKQKEDKIKIIKDKYDELESLLNEKTEKAEQRAEQNNIDIDKRYNFDLEDEYNKLSKIANTSYGNSLTDKDKAKDYSSQIVKILGDYLKKLSTEDAKKAINNDIFIKNSTTEQERKNLLSMLGKN